MAETVLITGAAGFLGSHLAVELALSGVRVYALARGQGDACAPARFDALRDYFQGPGGDRPRGIWPPPGLTVIEGDIELPWLGLGHRPARRLFEELDQVVHCAARVEFSASHRDELLATNVRALEGFLPLLRSHLRSDGPVFNLVSTAYVCGVDGSVGGDEPALEEPVPASRGFRNPYEESKALAERWVLERLGTRGVSWRILRPSILVGETITGRTRSFNALYTLLELLDGLRPAAANLTAASPTERLRVQCPPDSALNLVPVDWVTTAMRVLLKDPRTLGGIFHLTQPQPMTHRDLGTVLSRLFAPLQVEAASVEDFAAQRASRKEALLARGLRIYQPYLDRHPRFDDRRARKVLDAAGIACPPVNEIWLGRLVDYARAARWGRSLPGTGETTQPGTVPGDLRAFFDVHLPGFRGRPLLPGTRQVDAVFEIRLTDVPGFRRTVEIRGGEIQRVDASPRREPECRYEMSSGVLRQILAARLDPREAFFARQTEIRGDMEAGLRVASLMVDFFRQNPFEHPAPSMDALGALAGADAR